MCGIFGAISKDPNNIDIDKVVILGILNEERGTTSCGISLGDEILIGTGTESKFRNFAYNLRGVELTTPYIIGHTRQASVGVASKDNAHPFGFGDNPKTDGFQMIGVHNGTLYNYEELAESRNIDLKVVDYSVEPVTTRTKIDSEILLESIYKDKNFSILEQYWGGAALAFVNTISGEVHLYSGESNKGTMYYKKMEVERPLHVWVVNDELLYFSSEPDPLIVIAGADQLDNIFQIDTNTVYTIKNGDFKNALKKKINRSEESQVKTLNPKYIKEPQDVVDVHDGYRSNAFSSVRSNNVNLPISFASLNNSAYSVTTVIGHHKKSTVYSNQQYRPTDNNTSLDISVYDRYGLPSMCNFRYAELNPKSKLVDKLNGIYIRIEGRGLYKVGDTYEEVSKFYIKNRYSKLNIATDVICSSSSEENPKGFLRDIFKPLDTLDNLNIYCIYDGFILKDYTDYLYMITGPAQVVKLNGELDLYKLSHMTQLPIKIEDKYYHEGMLFTGNVRHVLLDRTYYISSGEITIGTAKTYIEDNYAVDARSISSKYYENLNKSKEPKILELPLNNTVTKEQALVALLNKYNPRVISICNHIRKGMILTENPEVTIKHLFLEIIDIYEKQPNDVDFYIELHNLLKDEIISFESILDYFKKRALLATSAAEQNYLTSLTKLLKAYE